MVIKDEVMAENLEVEEYTTEQLLDAVVLGLQEKKGINIAVLDMRQLENAVCQYFVICEGDSNVHVAAVADSVEEYVWKQLHEWPLHTEGKSQGQWVLVDFVDIVVHVFQKSVRPYYNLEGLWADAKRTDIENLF
ncbi:MAG: ribosome silencing factor [Breznakibacter sp.]